MVDEAHRAGMRVAAHAHGAEGIKAAILGGVDTIEHASLVDDEGIRLALAHGSYFDVDIYNTDYTQAEGRKNGVLEENLQKDRDIGEIQRQNFRKALKAGRREDDLLLRCGRLSARGPAPQQFAVMVPTGRRPCRRSEPRLTAAQAPGPGQGRGPGDPGHYGDLVG